MFKKALLFDSWLFPLREEAEKLAKSNITDNNVFFVNWYVHLLTLEFRIDALCAYSFRFQIRPCAGFIRDIFTT